MPVSRKRYDEMWCMVMFDLPVQTEGQRKQATRFRKTLLDLGFSMIQFSVYARYSPTLNTSLPIEKLVTEALPPDGEVRMLHLTDNQWAKTTRFRSKKTAKMESAPEQIAIF